MKKAIIIVAVVAIGMAIFVWPRPFGSRQTKSQSAQATSLAVVRRGDISLSVSATGVVEPILAVELKSKASGEIIQLPVEEGDHVRQGELIARLDAATARHDFEQKQADLEVAKAALSYAEKQAERQRQLYEQKLISDIDYEAAVLAKEQAKSNLIRARTALEDAKEKLAETIIKSPIDGIVLKKAVEIGQIIASGISAVSGGTPIATVADMRKVQIRAAVDEVDIGQIKVGQKAIITPESYPDRELSGQVLRIVPQAKMEQNVTTFDVIIEVDNQEGLLMAGMNAGVEIIAGQKENVLLIPREALIEMPKSLNPGSRPAQMVVLGQPALAGPPQEMKNKGAEATITKANNRKKVVVIEKGQPTTREITIGLANYDIAEVTSGLGEGDTVMIEITSKALQDRQAFMERMQQRTQVPGLQRRRQ